MFVRVCVQLSGWMYLFVDERVHACLSAPVRISFGRNNLTAALWGTSATILLTLAQLHLRPVSQSSIHMERLPIETSITGFPTHDTYTNYKALHTVTIFSSGRLHFSDYKEFCFALCRLSANPVDISFQQRLAKSFRILDVKLATINSPLSHSLKQRHRVSTAT